MAGRPRRCDVRRAHAPRETRRAARAARSKLPRRRGLEIFLLAFLFRLQAFVFTPGGPSLTVFRVDILNVMGPAMAAAGLLWAAGRSTRGRVALVAAAAALVAMTTPIVRASSAVDLLPVWFQWYIRPAGEMTTFTLLPWAGFVFAGGAVGVLIAAAGDAPAERRLQAALGVAGVTLIAVGFWTSTRPSIYASSSFWTTLTRVVRDARRDADARADRHRTSRPPSLKVRRPARRCGAFGRASLFIYWIHVELVYGYASWLWRHRLPIWATALAYAAFCVLMYGVVVLRDRVSRRPERQMPVAASA